MGTHTPDIGQDQARSSQSPVLSSQLESAMVVPKVATINFQGPSDLQSGTTVPKSKRGKDALPTMANPFLYSARLTPNAVRQKIRTSLSLHDIAPQVKVQWLQSAQTRADGNLKTAFQSEILKIKKQAKAAKYPIFFDLHPIVDYAFAVPDVQEPGTSLDRLLLQLRLTTLMRSVDVSNIVWGLFEHRNRVYIHTTNKNVTLATF